MTLRKKLAALAVAGLTLPGCTNPLLAPYVRHVPESADPAESHGARPLWKQIFATHASRHKHASGQVELQPAPPAPQFEERGEKDQAETLLETKLRNNPHDGTTHHRLGVLLAKRGDLQGAEKHLRAAVRENPQSVEAANDLGYCCFLSGRQAEAEAFLRQALQLDPDHAIAASNLAHVLRERSAVVAGNELPAPAATEAAPRTMPPVVNISKSASQPAPQESSKSEFVVLPEPATEAASDGETTREEAAPIEEVATKAAPAPRAEITSRAAAPDSDLTPTEPDPDSTEVASTPAKAPKEKMVVEKIANLERSEEDAPARPAAEPALVRLVDKERYAIPCASPMAAQSPATEAPSQNELSIEDEEEIRISSYSPAATPIIQNQVASAEDVFERYEPVRINTTATAPAGTPLASAAPRRTLFGDVLPKLSRESGREAPAIGSLPPKRTATSPPSQPSRRSLLSTLRSINPLK